MFKYLRDYGTLFVLGKIYYRKRKSYIFYFMLSILYLVQTIQQSILSWLNFNLALWPKYHDNNKSMIIMSVCYDQGYMFLLFW